MIPVKALITGHVRYETKYFVARCNELPITNSGDTADEAVERQADAALGYLSALKDVDPERCADLLQRITIQEEPPAPTSNDKYAHLMPEMPITALADSVA